MAAIHTVITRGFGTFGTIALVVTAGYGAIVTPTPAARISAVAAESRSVPVIAQSMTRAITAEARITPVDSETRVLSINAEPRTKGVT